MFFGKKDKDVRLTDKEYKSLVGGMSKKERRDFDRRQRDLKDYSPTTMYEDYSINEEYFHWQSQSTTSDTSPTGQRYINHVCEGSKVILFVREFKKDMAGAAPYTYLGTAKYVSHYGSRPMSITWHLDNPIPAKYIKKTSKLEVG